MEQALDKNSSKVLFSIAMEAESRRMYPDADCICSKARSYSQKAKWHQSSEYAYTLVRYADLCMDNGRLEKAEAFLREALQIFADLFGLDHMNTALIMRSLAEVLAKQGKANDAEEMLASARSALSSYKVLAS